MQMMTKQSNLKHEIDIFANKLKERDKAILLLQERELLINKMRNQMCIFMQEKEKDQHQVSFTTKHVEIIEYFFFLITRFSSCLIQTTHKSWYHLDEELKSSLYENQDGNDMRISWEKFNNEIVEGFQIVWYSFVVLS